MGVDASRLEPPSHWPLLDLDEAALHALVAFVKSGDGSLRITKWEMLEFMGAQALQDIAHVFSTFDEAEDATVSSLHLIVALLLCNSRVPVKFKVAECLRLFDWGDEGTMTVYDLQFLLQSCLRAVSSLVAGVPQNVAQDALDELCDGAVDEDEEVSSLDALATWVQANSELVGILAVLSPQDTVVASAKAAPEKQRSAADKETGAKVRATPSTASERRTSVMSPKKSSKSTSGRTEAEWDTAAGEAPEDPVLAAEPPLVPSPPPREARVVAIAGRLERTLGELSAQIREEEQRQQLHEAHDTQAALPAMERQWAAALGAALPLLPPPPAPPSTAVLRAAIEHNARVAHASAMDGARFEAALAAASLGGAGDAMAALERRRAWGLAAEMVEGWLGDRSGTSSAEDASAERRALEARELDLARAAEAGAAARARALRRDARRHQGAAAFLAASGDLAKLPEATALRTEAAEAARVHEAAQDDGGGARAEYLAVRLARAAFASAAAAGQPVAVTDALRERVEELRTWSATGRRPGAAGDAAVISTELLEATEPQWRRCEGAGLALEALFAQAPLRVCGRLDLGTRRAEARELLGAGRQAAPRRLLRRLEGLGAAMRGAPGGASASFGPLAAAVLDAAALAGEASASTPEAVSEERGAEVAGAEAGGAEGSADAPSPQRLRELRFDARAWRASVASAQKAVPGCPGGPQALERLQAEAKAAEGRLEAGERSGHGEIAARRRAKRRRAAEDVLRRCLSAAGVPVAGDLAALPPSVTLGGVSDVISAALRRTYARLHEAVDLEGEAFESLDAPPDGCERHLLFEARSALEGGSEGDICEVGLVTSRLHAEAAAQLGRLHTQELVVCLRSRHLAPASAEEVAALVRCAALRAEARLLEAVASHRLALAEAEMRRAAEALAGDDSADVFSPSVTAPRFAPSGRRTSLPMAEDAGAADDGEGAGGPAGAAMDELLAVHLGPDVQAALRAAVAEEVLAPLAGEVASELLEAVADTPEAPESADDAPQVPHPSAWWRVEAGACPLFAAPGRPPPHCMEFARIVGVAFVRRRCGPSGDVGAVPPRALEEYAAALRVWVWARHRMFAHAALARGCWAAELSLQAWRDREAFAYGAWLRELSRGLAAEHTLLRRLCLQRASGFVRPLNPSNAVFLSDDGLLAEAEAIRADLDAALAEQARAKPSALCHGAMGGGGHSALAEALQSCSEELRALCNLMEDPVAKAQLYRCIKTADSVQCGAPRVAACGRDEDYATVVGAIGALCAIGRLRSFCARSDIAKDDAAGAAEGDAG